MEINLLQKIKSYFSDEVINKLSSQLGEEPTKVRSGVDAAIPSLLLGLQGNNSDGLSSILTSAKHLFSSFHLDDIVSGYFGGDGGAGSNRFESDNLVSSIFGDKLSGIVTTIGSFLGLKSDSVKGIFGAAIPSLISGLTNKGGNWDVGSILGTLNSEKSSFASALPAGLGLGAFGSAFAKAESPIELNANTGSTEPVRPAHEHVEPVIRPVNNPPSQHAAPAEENKKGAGLWWLLIPLLLIGGWFLFGKGCEGDKTTGTTDTLSTRVDTMATLTNPQDTIKVVRELIDVKLPDGKLLKGYSSGIEETLIAFLQSDYKSLSDDQLKEKWFDFDNLNFETGTAKVVPESQQQLDNIAAILSLFPDAKIKIGGYTDKTGDESHNKKLSQERAAAVKNFLTEKGLGGQVVDAEGYGSEFAKVDASAPDAERQKDRRVAVSVRK